MSWLQISFAVQSSELDTTESALELLGALSITLLDEQDEPILEPAPGETPVWSRTRVVALFEADQNPQQLSEQLCRSLPQLDRNAIQFKTLEDQDWERAWLKDFKPMQFGSQLWVIPDTYTPPDSDAVNLYLDPGLAFGSGTHATTAMCLEWLADHFRGRYTDGGKVLDFGCGSGILAIAAAKLGASQIFAHDIDPQALEATESNAIKNHVGKKIQLVDPSQVKLPELDLIIANILAKPLIRLSEKLASLAHSGTDLVLSGILQDQADEVIQAYHPWFEIKVSSVTDDWCLLVGQAR
jgi:ribosomal protein L11 methyltransferase